MGRVCVGFWLGLVAVYGLLAMGYVDTTDAAASVETAIAIVERGSVELDPQAVGYIDSTMIARGKSGGRFSKMGLSMPVLYVPPVIVGKLMPLPGFTERQRIDFFVSFVTPIVTASLVAILFLFVQRSGHAQPFLFACTAGFATLLLPYSKSAHREPLQALCLLVLYGSLMPDSRPRFFVAGVALGVGLLTKQAFLVPAIPAVAWVAWLVFRLSDYRSRVRAIAGFALPALVLSSAWALFSYRAWETIFFTGYSPATTSFSAEVWRTPFAQGLLDQLVSTQKGLVAYDPLATILLVFSVVALLRGKLGGFETALMMAVALQVALYAKWISPSGHEALGPRYLIVVIPLLFLIVRNAVLPERRWIKTAFAIVITFCFAIQLVPTCVKMQQFYTLQARAGASLAEPHWRANWTLFAHKLSGRPEVYSPRLFGLAQGEMIDVRDVRSFAGLNFWWWHLWRKRAVDCPTEVSSL